MAPHTCYEAWSNQLLAWLQAWDAAHTGLLVSERLVNCPPQLAPPLNQALFDEIEWAQEDEPTQVIRLTKTTTDTVPHPTHATSALYTSLQTAIVHGM